MSEPQKTALLLTGIPTGATTICEVDDATAKKIIRDFKPMGLFLNETIGIDNSTGDCWVEDFGSREEAVRWLLRD